MAKEKASRLAGRPPNEAVPPEGSRLAKRAKKSGAAGTRAIKAEGSIMLAQDEASAAFAEGEADWLNKVFILLRKHSGVEFDAYKRSTIHRRIGRRMMLHDLTGLKDYVRFLQDSPDELDKLFDDIVICVTEFFRDAASFDFLRERIFPALVRNASAGAPLRIWVPGCSTGEEAYSIAISLMEYLEASASNPTVQVFGTDISEKVIQKARLGIYKESEVRGIPQDLLQKYLDKVESGYQIGKAIRELCVFAPHNLLSAPPFSKMDLISCRNVLIYLGPVLQDKVFPVLHDALAPQGFLMLGTSESIGKFADLFGAVDGKHRIYAKKSVANAPDQELSEAIVQTVREPLLVLDADLRVRLPSGGGTRQWMKAGRGGADFARGAPDRDPTQPPPPDPGGGRHRRYGPVAGGIARTLGP